jgi:hypothetical protein
VNTIQINYDLKKPGRNYEPVYDYLKSYPTRCPLLDSCWLVRTNKTAGDVRDDLMQLVDRGDEVATFDVTGDSWGTNFTDKRTEWLHNNMGYARAA